MPFLRLKASLGLDGRGFKTGLDESKRRVSGFADFVQNRLAAAFGAAAVTRSTKAVIAWGSAITDAAIEMGLSNKRVQEQMWLFDRAGLKIEQMTAAFAVLARNRAEALGGNQRKEDAFAALGINRETLAVTENLDDLFRRIGSTIQTMDFDATTAANFQQVFGESGSKLLRVFAQDMDAVVQQFRDMQIAVGDEYLDALDRMDDGFKNIGQTLKSFVAPAIAEVSDLFNHLFEKVQTAGGGKFFRAAREAFTSMIPLTILGKLTKVGGGEGQSRQEQMHQRAKALFQASVAPPAEKVEAAAAVAKEVARAVFKPDADSLAKIGGFTGNNLKMANVQDRQLVKLTAIEAALVNRGVKIRE